MLDEAQLKKIKIDLLAAIVYKKQVLQEVESMLADPEIVTGRAEKKHRKVLKREIFKLFKDLANANLQLRELKYGKAARKRRKENEQRSM